MISESTPELWKLVLENTEKHKMTNKKYGTIYHPEFLEASKLIDDKFWKETLISCSKKKFPRGFKYENHLLTFKLKELSILLPDSYIDFAKTAIAFFRENGKIYSTIDKTRLKEEEEKEILFNLLNYMNDWTKITRSKLRRSFYIHEYVKRKYKHLNKNISNELYTQINIGFETGLINKTMIIFNNYLIEDITCIDADENGVIYKTQLPNIKSLKVKPYVEEYDKKYEYFNNWKNHLKLFEEYLNLSSESVHTIIYSNQISS